MKTFAKSVLAGGALLTAGMVQAANISIGISYDPNAESNFQSLLNPSYVTEDFNNLGVQGSGASYYGGVGQAKQQLSWEDSSPQFFTKVGTFTLVQAGQTYTHPDLDPNDGNNLKIESSNTGEFSREELASDSQDFWLDSNDAQQVTWDFTTGDVAGGNYNAFGFYVADPADVAAQLTLTFSDGTYSDAFTIPFGQSNGNVGYVMVKSDMSIVGGTLTFDNSASNDGWGIDDVTVGKLPEPGTLLLMGLGLLGLGAARRRAAK
ncbi:PEP-CTERM sorting domain-containing protein [Marinimicrobium sp. ARAG 43.8]|uniref:PEP-CTERM sorting domain-containing protein n=1 Tax=Marinimicrobium sp. ARAG 43.8 TaxID=3418719 RepID=UPI003CEACC47